MENRADFQTRVIAVAAAAGVKIKAFSGAFAADWIRNSNEFTEVMTDQQIAERAILLAEARPDQVILTRPLQRLAVPPPPTATEKLAAANAEHRKNNPSVTQTTELSELQRSRIERFGPEYALALANEASHAKGDGK